MASSSVVPLISLWEDFLSNYPNGNVHAFASWILKQKKQKLLPRRKGRKKISLNGRTDNEMTDESRAMLLIYRLNRFIDIRAKPVIKEIGFAKPQEFAMLAEIYLLQKPNKNEVAKSMLIEVSTAVEISKRLVQRGLIKEISDPNDKRATRLVITEKGMKKLYESYTGLQGVHGSFLDCLNDTEKSELLRLLEELEKFQSGLV